VSKTTLDYPAPRQANVYVRYRFFGFLGANRFAAAGAIAAGAIARARLRGRDCGDHD
jgi:hypothetical protein